MISRINRLPVSMLACHLIIFASWIVLLVFWTVLGIRGKHSIAGKWKWRREIGLRVAIAIVVLLALHFLGVHRVRSYVVNTSLAAGYAGAALCAAGVSLSVWARVCLGKSWDLPMTERPRAEFVTRGPYARIRHPIYAGLMLAIFGSAIGQSVLWAIPLLLLCPYFIHSARREETLMSEQFPVQYPEYRKRTKMLIPSIF